ncbi:hypothetical protein ACFSRY_00675 [Pontibacter locisalis]|uniref:HD domain-containing protein n=1 Tax=Pontibacter locisalis TaxID=1719035 RepID=A0ABW5IGH8_9BACT
MGNGQVKAIWEKLISRYTSNLQGDELWKELEKAYTSEERSYHTLHHLGYMLQLAEQYKPEIKHFDALRFAIFYHDIIYHPAAKDNEEKSAELAMVALNSAGVKPEELELIRKMIRATKEHQEHRNKDINLLLDFDLAILGTEWDKYDTYRKQVRIEYKHFPDAVFNHGRKQVLQSFLAQPSIFKTPQFEVEREAKARENLTREIYLLQ